MLRRMIRALKLDPQLFEEVEHDTTATGQAAGVVIIASVLFSIWSLMGGGIMGFIGSIVTALFGWLVWSVLSYFIGTALFGGKADLGEVLRALGFAYTPLVFGVIPLLGHLVGIVWAIVAFVIALRQALDFTTGKAIGTAILAFIGFVVVAIIVNLIFGGFSPAPATAGG